MTDRVTWVDLYMQRHNAHVAREKTATQETLSVEKEGESEPSKSIKPKSKKTKKHRDVRRRYAYESEEDESDDGEGGDVEYYYTTKKKPNITRRQPPPPKGRSIKRKLKKGSGPNYIKYGKEFSKAMSHVPEKARPEVIPYIRGPLHRGFKEFCKALVHDPTLQTTLSDAERAAIMDGERKEILKELAFTDCNQCDERHLPVTNSVMDIIHSFEEVTEDKKASPVPPQKKKKRG